MEKFFGNNTRNSSFHQGGACLERPRLRKLLSDAMNYPLVVVCAGLGYGKTQAVHSFLQGYEAHKTWMQFSERDNIRTRYWERYSNVISLSWPEAGARLMEIGFPETDESFMKFSAIMNESIAVPGRHVAVLDDFHLLNNPVVLHFFERAVGVLPPNSTVILISRTTPEINLIGSMMRGLVYSIQEDTLCFTEKEIADYFNMLGLAVTRQDIRNIYDDTQGWAFAINMIGRSLIKEHKYERYALEAMKKNVFRLIEAEVIQIVSEKTLHFLVRISLIDHLAASLIRDLTKDDTLIKDMEALNAYIRYDFSLDTYMIHHLFLEYLRQKQDHLLTPEEKRETYQVAGAWCDANRYHADALSYYEKSGDYGVIARNVAAFNIQIPLDMAQHALEIFDRAPDSASLNNPIFHAMYLKLKISMGQLELASELVEQYVKEYEALPESPERNRALCTIFAAWGVLRKLDCTYTDVYDFDIYFKKMSEYYEKSPFVIIGSFSSSLVSAWASLVGTCRVGAHEEYIQANVRAIPYVSRVLKGNLCGFDNLIQGELCFYRQEFVDAQQYLKQSHDKAHMHGQYITQNQALVYLMQIAFFQGDYIAADKFLKDMENMLSEKDNGVRYTMYDIACGFYYLALGRMELIPDWLKGDFSPYTHPAFLENFGNRVKALYHYHTRQYSSLLAYIDSVRERRIILFGNIELKVLQALSLYQLKRRVEAIAALTEAYHLAKSNNIIVPFTQHMKDMRTLTAAALRDDCCQIPREWIENINRKASAFAKRRSYMISKYVTANQLETEISLTEREIEILRDLSHGLSRTEIAASQNISVNTVKMVINIIYDKLRVTSLPEAIRVALNKKLV